MDQLLSQYKNPYTRELSVHKKIRNAIKTGCKQYNGSNYNTTLNSLYFLVHNSTKEDVNKEVAKWIDLKGVDVHTLIVLPERFFH
jgi:hypothetical protein